MIQFSGICSGCDRQVTLTMPFAADSTAHGPPETWARCQYCRTPVPVERGPAEATPVAADGGERQ